jgi:HNH endonuclease/AP2 domain
MKLSVSMVSVEFKIIKLTQDQYTIVDADTFVWASKYKWHAAFWKNGFYANRRNGKGHIPLHREILNAPTGSIVDHINGDTLDNRKENLRLCTSTENTRNQRLVKRNTSGYKGVSWHKHQKKWIVRIRVNRKLIHLGYYKELIAAAKAYDVAARFYFKEFANLNFKD